MTSLLAHQPQGPWASCWAEGPFCPRLQQVGMTCQRNGSPCQGACASPGDSTLPSVVLPTWGQSGPQSQGGGLGPCRPWVTLGCFRGCHGKGPEGAHRNLDLGIVALQPPGGRWAGAVTGPRGEHTEARRLSPAGQGGDSLALPCQWGFPGALGRSWTLCPDLSTLIPPHRLGKGPSG